MQLAVSFTAAAILAHASVDPLPATGVYRDLGGGLVLTPTGEVVDVFSLPNAVSPQELEMWNAMQPVLSWSAAVPSHTGRAFGPQRRPPVD
jgi:hypothetical protein